MNSTRKITFAGLGVFVLVGMLLAPLASADNHEEFGTQVTFGDADFIPTFDARWTAGFTANTDVCVVTYGDGQNVGDFGFYLQPDQLGLGTVQRNALRLVEIFGNAAGTMVRDQDNTEIGQNCAAAAGTPRLKFGDVNNNGRYDAGDYVWLTTAGAGAGLTSSTSATAWTIRLTETSGGPAGSVVFAQDADFTSYNGNAMDTLNANSRVAYFNADRSFRGSGANCPGTLGTANDCSTTPGDHLYMAISETTAPVVGGLVPLYSIRLAGPAGAFGSQVGLEDGDFIPALNEIALAAAAFDEMCVVTFGETSVSNFGFYLNGNAGITLGTTTVGVNFIRLVSPHGDPGSLVRSADLQEVGQPCVNTGLTGYALVYADRNNNGRYDMGDWVFLTSNAVGTVGLVASSANNAWTIRLTDTDGGDAGTLVRTGDSDFISYQNNAPSFPQGPTGATQPALPAPWGVFDRDRSGVLGAGQIVTPGDSIYLGQSGAALAAAQVPVYSIRVVGDMAFGSQVTFGDSDFRPTLAGFTNPAVCVVMFGDGTNIADAGFYLVSGGGTATVPTNAVRLNSVQGMNAGSVVRDSDTVERGQGCSGGASILFAATTAARVQVHYTDRNNNGRYDEGDGLYLTTHPTVAPTGLTASTGAAQWTLRMTEASGGAQGTIVFAGDSDFVTYQNAAPELTAATVNLFDEDLSGVPGAPYSRGDTVYVSPGALGATPVTPLHSIRVTGSLPVGTAPPPPPPTDGDDDVDGNVTPPPPADDDDDVTPPPPADGDDTTPPPPADADAADGDGEDTPAPALLLVLAALGAVLVAVRRRR